MNPDPPSHDDMQDRHLRDLQDDIHALKAPMPEQKKQECELSTMLEDAVARGFRRVMIDPQLRADFWRAGYEEFEKHAGSSAAQWVGRKVIHILLAAMLAGLITWAVISGRFK